MVEKKCKLLMEIDISLYGRFFDLRRIGPGVNHYKTLEYSDGHTKMPLISTLGSLGMTRSSPLPFTTNLMERHMHTEEAQFCGSEPIALLLGQNNEELDAPVAEDLIAVVVPLGFVLVVNPGIWHSASHCLFTENSYYWFANAYPGEPTEWKEILGGPVLVYN